MPGNNPSLGDGPADTATHQRCAHDDEFSHALMFAEY